MSNIIDDIDVLQLSQEDPPVDVLSSGPYTAHTAHTAPSGARGAPGTAGTADTAEVPAVPSAAPALARRSVEPRVPNVVAMRDMWKSCGMLFRLNNIFLLIVACCGMLWHVACCGMCHL